MAWVDRFVRQNGTRIAVRDFGGEGLAVLLLHGLTHNVCAWNKVGPRLARRFRVAAFDLRDHGLTESKGDYSLAAQLADIDAIRGALDMGPTLLVGHSVGGVLSVAYASDRATEVPGVVNVDGSVADPAEYSRELGIDREAEKRQHDAWLESEWRFEGDSSEVDRWLSEQRRQWDEWLRQLEAEPSHTNVRAFVESFDDVEPMLRRQLNEVAAGRYERKPSPADWARLSSELLDPLWGGVSVLYERLETPLLVIVARRPLGPGDVSEEQVLAVERRMLDRLRRRHQATQVVWVESSHNVPLVLPDELSEMIGDFARHLGA